MSERPFRDALLRGLEAARWAKEVEDAMRVVVDRASTAVTGHTAAHHVNSRLLVAGSSTPIRGQRMGTTRSGKNTRVGFNSMQVALGFLAEIASSSFAVQFTTYPPPRIQSVEGGEGPCATMDFADESWAVDVVQLLRDLTPYHAVGSGRRLGQGMSGGDADAAFLSGICLNVDEAAVVLRSLLCLPEQYPAVEATWRLGARDAMAHMIFHTIEAHEMLSKRLPR